MQMLLIGVLAVSAVATLAATPETPASRGAAEPKRSVARGKVATCTCRDERVAPPGGGDVHAARYLALRPRRRSLGARDQSRVAARATIKPAPQVQGPGLASRKILEMPEQVGLYWVSWLEDGNENGDFVFNGPMLCEDIHMGPAPAGRVATCVPREKSALAHFVPDPLRHCR
ncbi:MAG: hypothetical protein HC882_08320 [Acidobacteria bacterium]|nr:hypothetical protein [Acidobacteriota bacterium]